MKVAMKAIGVTVGGVGVLLGGLWLLQGLGLVEIDPIACVGDCVPVRGASPMWAVIGFVVLAAGAVAIYYSLRRRAPPSS